MRSKHVQHMKMTAEVSNMQKEPPYTDSHSRRRRPPGRCHPTNIATYSVEPSPLSLRNIGKKRSFWTDFENKTI